MRLNRFILGVLLLMGSVLASAPLSDKEERISYIHFKQISLENLFDYLSARYGVNVIIEEPMVRYYTTSLRLNDVSVEEVIAIATKEYGLHYVKKEGSYHVSTRRKYHEENYNTHQYITRSVKIRYASVTDVITLLKDVMHGTVVVRSSTENEPYRNLFDATPDLEKIEADSGSQSQSGSGNQGILPNEGGGQNGGTQNRGMQTGMAGAGMMGGAAGMPGAGGAGMANPMMNMMGMQENVPGRLLYVVPFFNENILYLMSKDKGLIKEARSYIMEVDQPIKEVLIQGKIINVGLDDEFSSFFEFNQRAKHLESQSDNPNSVVSIGNLQYTFLDSLTNMNIEILQNEGKAKTIASPMLMTANRNQATLDLVEEISIIKGWTAGTVTQVEGGGAVSVPPSPQYQSEKIGTEFEIIPYINDDEKILLKIRITVSTLKPGSQQILVPNAGGGYDTKQLDGVSKTTIETTLVTTNGQGIVLGGLVNETVSKQENKVPLLGDIPILGFPFKDVQDVTNKSEMVVVLTPYITDLDEPKAHQTIDTVHRSLEEDRYILQDDKPQVSGVKILDNVFKGDAAEKVERWIGDDTPEVRQPTAEERKIEAFLNEEK